jgi:hypothetical protein
MTRKFAIPIILVFAANLLLLIIDGRILVWETKVRPGEHYVVQEHGDLGKSGQASLACRYWTGRSVTTTVLWYSSNNILGRDQCPFFVKVGE